MARHSASVKNAPAGARWQKGATHDTGGANDRRLIFMLSAILNPVLWLFSAIVDLIILVLIVNAVLSWLIAFDVVNRRNQVVDGVWTFSNRVTDPMLKPIRRIVPLIGGIDLSPLILMLGLLFIRQLVFSLVGYAEMNGVL
jgi:YggT family protein